MYVRYVSHELRTPLNTAVLGLQLVLKAPNRNRTVRDRERYDILCDVSESCSAAVTVLDGLLDFDKMQHGLLKLNKSDEVVKTFLEGAIITFADEAKESNITLNFQMSESSEDTQSQLHPPLPSPLPHPLSLLSPVSLSVPLSVSTPVPIPLPIPLHVSVPPAINTPTLIPPAAMDRDASGDCALPNHLASNYLNVDSNNGFSLVEQVANVSGNIGTNRGRGGGRVRDGDRGSDVCASACAGNTIEGESTYSRYLPTGWMNHSRPHSSSPQPLPPPLSILLPLLPHDTVSIDKTRIGQVIKGLISNALKFTTSGGCVTVRTFFLKDDVPDNVKSKPKGRYLRSFPTPCNCRKAPRTKLCKWKTNMNRSRVMHCPDSSSRPLDVQTCSHLFPSRDDEGPQYGRLVITVSDTGCGLSAEKVKKFSSEKMMFNLEKLEAIDDIGIGFHISRGILGQHGGTISVTSEGVGRGCTFRVELPMIKTPPPLSRPQSSPQSQSQSQFPSRHHTHPQSPPRHQSLSHANSQFPSAQNYKYTHTHPLHTDARPHNNCTSVHPYDAQADVANLEDSSRNRDRAEVLSTDAYCAMKSDCESSCETIVQESLPSHLENKNVNVMSRLNVLIVDDSALNRKMLLKILVKEGHTCREACDGQAAVDIMKQEMQRKSERAFVGETETVTKMGREGEKARVSVRGRGRGGNGLLDYRSSDDKPSSLSPSHSPCQFNVILMDYVMPIMDGPTATSVIRDLGYRGPIFGVTGNGESCTLSLLCAVVQCIVVRNSHF